MGLNMKGKSWASIYHRIESLCQNVDDFVSQGTVKLGENQMQNVGINVKRFYSNVVQDTLTRLDDIESTKSQSVNGEQVDTLGHVNSVTDITRNPTSTNEKQLSVDQVSVVDIVRNSDASLQIEVEPLHADSSQKSEICRHFEEKSEALIWNEIFNGSSDEFNENSTFTSSSPALSSCDEEEEQESQEDVKDVEEVDKEEIVEEEKEQDVQEEEEERSIKNSTYSTLTKCSYILDSTLAAGENISLFNVEPNDFDYEMKVEDLLPASLLLELNVPTSTSVGDNAFPIDVQDSVLSSSKMSHEKSYKDGQSEAAIIPSETGNSSEFGVGIDDHNMETVNLSPDMKGDARSIGFNINLVPAASRRSKDFTYYKKLIQAAFTTRKRLSKEYKHLAILHGDIDFESSSIPSSPCTSVHAMKTLTSHETSESDWELL